MTDLEMKLYMAWRNGNTQIMLSEKEVVEVLSAKCNNTDTDHDGCNPYAHQIDFVNKHIDAEITHVFTYRYTLKILMKDGS